MKTTDGDTMHGFTMEQFAHFDRCLYPGDFRHDCVEAGMSDADAFGLASFIISKRRAGGSCGIIDIYREYAQNKDIIVVLEKLMYDFTTEITKG